MGGIGLSCNTTSTGYLTHTHNTHTIRTQYAHNPAHTHAHTHTPQQYTDTRYTHTQIQNTEHNNMQHTQNRTTPVQHRGQHNLNAHTQHNLVHIVLIFITYNNISKNSIT